MSDQAKTARSVTGQVTSNKGDKTIAVVIERRVKHPLYKKCWWKNADLFPSTSRGAW